MFGMLSALSYATHPPLQVLPVATAELGHVRRSLLMVTGGPLPGGQWTVVQDPAGARAEVLGYDGKTTPIASVPKAVLDKLVPPTVSGSWALTPAERKGLLDAAPKDCVEPWCEVGSSWVVRDIACYATIAGCAWRIERPGRSVRCIVYAEPPAIESRPPARIDLVEPSGEPRSKLTSSITTCLDLTQS